MRRGARADESRATGRRSPRASPKGESKKGYDESAGKSGAPRGEYRVTRRKAFSDKELRSQLKEQITTIETYGLSAARGDDAAFFLELFYRKHGYAKVNVHYTIEAGDRLGLDIDEGRSSLWRKSTLSVTNTSRRKNSSITSWGRRASVTHSCKKISPL